VRAEVEKIVQGVPNVRGVTNEAQLAPVTSFGERTNDSLITARSRRATSGRCVQPCARQGGDGSERGVSDGRGDEREADDAVDIARTTSGVRKVVKIFDTARRLTRSAAPIRVRRPKNRNPRLDRVQVFSAGLRIQDRAPRELDRWSAQLPRRWSSRMACSTSCIGPCRLSRARPRAGRGVARRAEQRCLCRRLGKPGERRSMRFEDRLRSSPHCRWSTR